MTLGGVLRTHMQSIAWWHACLHQVKPDIAALVERYGAEMEVPEGALGCAARSAAAATPILSCADIRGPQECASDKHLDPSRRNSAVDYLRPQVVRREL